MCSLQSSFTTARPPRSNCLTIGPSSGSFSILSLKSYRGNKMKYGFLFKKIKCHYWKMFPSQCYTDLCGTVLIEKYWIWLWPGRTAAVSPGSRRRGVWARSQQKASSGAPYSASVLSGLWPQCPLGKTRPNTHTDTVTMGRFKAKALCSFKNMVMKVPTLGIPRHFKVDNWLIFGGDVDQWEYNLQYIHPLKRQPTVVESLLFSLCFEPSTVKAQPNYNGKIMSIFGLL